MKNVKENERWPCLNRQCDITYPPRRPHDLVWIRVPIAARRFKGFDSLFGNHSFEVLAESALRNASRRFRSSSEPPVRANSEPLEWLANHFDLTQLWRGR